MKYHVLITLYVKSSYKFVYCVCTVCTVFVQVCVLYLYKCVYCICTSVCTMFVQVGVLYLYNGVHYNSPNYNLSILLVLT